MNAFADYEKIALKHGEEDTASSTRRSSEELVQEWNELAAQSRKRRDRVEAATFAAYFVTGWVVAFVLANALNFFTLYVIANGRTFQEMGLFAALTALFSAVLATLLLVAVMFKTIDVVVNVVARVLMRSFDASLEKVTKELTAAREAEAREAEEAVSGGMAAQ